MRALLLAAMVFGCSGDAPAPSPKCSGGIYEPCLEEHNCNSGLCQNFIDDGFQVCTQTCDTGNPCPSGECNANGLCQPAMPVDCEPL